MKKRIISLFCALLLLTPGFPRPLFPQARFVTVYAKPAGRSAVDVYAREMPDSWLVFPWD